MVDSKENYKFGPGVRGLTGLTNFSFQFTEQPAEPLYQVTEFMAFAQACGNVY